VPGTLPSRKNNVSTSIQSSSRANRNVGYIPNDFIGDAEEVEAYLTGLLPAIASNLPGEQKIENTITCYAFVKQCYSHTLSAVSTQQINTFIIHVLSHFKTILNVVRYNT
jgi:hypothetical protein